MTDRSGPLLRSMPIRELTPLGVDGDPVYRSHRQLTTTVKARLGEHCASLFARPELDNDSQTITWHAPVEGQVRSWSELAPEEQARLHGAYAALQDELLDLSTQLQLAGTEDRAKNRLAQVLDEAVSIPDASYLFFVGDQPVIAAWGFSGDAGQVDVRRLELPLASPKAPAPTASAGIVNTPAPASASRWSRWWWIPLLLLLALLLGWLLTQCSDSVQERVFDVPAVPSTPIPDEPQPEVPVPVERTDEVQPVDQTTRIVDGDGGTLIDGAPVRQEELGAIPDPASDGEGVVEEGAVPETTGEAPPEPGSDVEPQPDKADAQEAGIDEPGADEPGADEPGTDEPGADEQGAKTPQTEQSGADEQDPNNEAQQSPTPGELPPPPPPPGETSQPPASPENLTIPPNGQGKGIDFISGLWRAETGLVDRDTGKPLRQQYQFKDDGSGEVRLDRADGVTCTGTARAKRKVDGSVEIAEQGEIKCPDGRAYQPSVTHCITGPGGRAICRGKNQGGGPDFKVDITR